MRGRKPDPRLVYLDPARLERALVRAGKSRFAVAGDAELARNTVLAAFRGEGVFPDTAKRIAEALGVEDVATLRRNGDAEDAAAPEEGINEWVVRDYQSAWITAANGLQYRRLKLEHRHLAGRYGRGKCYDLAHLPAAGRAALRAHLLRHPTVCHRIGPHPHVAANDTVAPDSGERRWWVVDRWFDGEPLAATLARGPFPHEELPRLMTEVALGLETLHAAGVVFRDLAPAHVLVADEGGRAVLTDFELAKLLDGSPSVSADEWPPDPYRAPEVESGRADERSDLYSWARTLLHAHSGELPPKGRELELLAAAALPKAVAAITADCLSPAPSDRPRSVGVLLRALRSWSPVAKGRK